ncbi:MAG: CoA-binding protein [Candidatus Brocadiae bacterium]|nr:CoA-binding protein [Candidatus Brocadiia bacterium]
MSTCEIPKSNPSSQEISQIFQNAKTIAIVGLSNEPDKDSYHVAEYLKKNHYKIIPVNPKYPEILGEKSYSSLSEIPEKIDIVDVFRKPDAILSIAKECLQLKQKPKVFWMQLGLANQEAADMLEKEGIKVVQSKCTKIEHERCGF